MISSSAGKSATRCTTARVLLAATPALSLLIVNLSPHGLMARCEGAFTVGERVRIALPVVGVVIAEVRWALGGRVGCRLDQGIDRASYYELLAALMRR